jgi:ATP-dependent protease ClpP protease subunit
MWNNNRTKKRKLSQMTGSTDTNDTSTDLLKLLFEAKGDDVAEDLLHDENIVTRKHNQIHFYADVNKKTCHRLIQLLEDANDELAETDRKYGSKNSKNKIFLFINSDGGCVHSALSVVDRILQSEYEIVSIVEGVAASAATIISMVCHHRYIQPNAQMLIHELSSACWGKFHEMKEEVDNLDKLHKSLVLLYKKYTSLNKRELDKILLHDYMWTAKESKQKGFVDNIKNQRVRNMNIPTRKRD